MKKKLTPQEREAKLKDLYGTQMANLLFYVKGLEGAPIHIRMRADELQRKWDSVSPLRLMNPITLVELEKELNES